MAVHMNGGVQPAQNMQVDGPAGANGANAPAVLANARQGKSKAGRIIAAIFSFGISEGVRAIVKAVRSHRAPAPRAPQPVAQPAARPAADVLNKQLYDKLLCNKPLSPAMRAAISEGLESMRPAFGDAVPTNGNLPYELTHVVAKAVKHEPEEVTPERLRTMVADLGKPLMAKASLQVQSQALLREVGYNPGQDITPSVVTCLKDGPFADMQRETAACQNAEEVGTVLARYDAPIREYLTNRQEVETCERDVLANAYQRLSEASGISVDRLKTTDALGKLKVKMTYFISDLGKAENPVHGDALRAKFTEFANPMIEKKIQTVTDIDGLALSPAMKEDWKDTVLHSATLSDPSFLPKIVQSASDINVDSLVRGFEDPDLDDEGTLLLFQSVALKFQDGLKATFGEEEYLNLFKDPFVLENTRGFGMMALFDKHPDLVDALHAEPERFARIAETASLRADDARDAGDYEQANLNKLVEFAGAVLPPTVEQANETMAKNIANESRIPLAHVDALRSAIAEVRADFGADSFEAGESLGALRESSSGKRIIGRLAEQIKALDHIATPQEMKAMCKAAICNSEFTSHLSYDILNDMAQEAGIDLEANPTRNVFFALSARHPNLEADLAAAPNRDAMQPILQALPDAHDLMQLQATIQNVQAAAKNRAFTQLSELTGKTVDAIKAELKLTYVTNSYGVFTHDYTTDSKDPTKELPARDVVEARYNARMDRFLAEKTALYNVIPTLTGVGGRVISPALSERLQASVLNNVSMKLANPASKAAQIASRLAIGNLAAPLAARDFASTKAALLQIMQPVDTHRDAIFTPEEIEALDPDDLSITSSLVRQIFVDTDPDFATLLRNNEDFIRSVADTLEDVDVSRLTKDIAKNFGKPEVKPLQQEYGVTISVLNLIGEVIDRR